MPSPFAGTRGCKGHEATEDDVDHSRDRGFLAVTDTVVSLLPGPLTRLVQTPVQPERVGAAEAARRLLRCALVVCTLAVALLVVLHLLNALAWGRQFPALDADDDESVWSWASIATESVAAGVLGILTLASRRSPALTFCTWVVCFLSLDDFIRIHEKIGAEWSVFPHAARTLWPVLYLPLLATLFLLLWRVAQGFTSAEQVLVRAGLLALVVAVGLESLTPLLFAVGQGHGSVGYEVEVAVEESLELGGWVVIAGARASGLVRRLSRDRPVDGSIPAQPTALDRDGGAGAPVRRNSRPLREP